MESLEQRVRRLLKQEIGRSPQYIPSWWKTRHIRVLSASSVDANTTQVVVDAIRFQIAEMALPYPFHVLAIEAPHAVELLIANAMKKDGLDDRKMIAMLGWDSIQNGLGNVIITTERFYDDAASWGASQFWSGAIIFALYGNRQQNQHFLRKVVRHETMHMLGKADHCDEDKDTIASFEYDPRCLMHWSCRGSDFCPKCIQFVQVWWQEMQRLKLL